RSARHAHGVHDLGAFVICEGLGVAFDQISDGGSPRDRPLHITAQLFRLRIRGLDPLVLDEVGHQAVHQRVALIALPPKFSSYLAMTHRLASRPSSAGRRPASCPTSSPAKVPSPRGSLLFPSTTCDRSSSSSASRLQTSARARRCDGCSRFA